MLSIKWDAQKKALDKAQAQLKDFLAEQTDQLGAILSSQTARFLLASRKLGPADNLDSETLARWEQFLSAPKREYPYLDRWFELASKGGSPAEFEAAARLIQEKVEQVNEEKHTIDEKNKIKLGLNPSRNDMSQADLFSLPIEQYNFWRDVFSESRKDSGGAVKSREGVLYYGGNKIDRFLSGEWKRRLNALRQNAAELKKALPAQYPFLETIKDKPDPHRFTSADVAATSAIAVATWPRGTCPPFCMRGLRLTSPKAAAVWSWRRALPTRPIRSPPASSSIAFGCTISDAASWKRRAISAIWARNPPTPSYWITWPRGWWRAGGRSRASIARSCCLPRTRAAPRICRPTRRPIPATNLSVLARQLAAHGCRDSPGFAAVRGRQSGFRGRRSAGAAGR